MDHQSHVPRLVKDDNKKGRYKGKLTRKSNHALKVVYISSPVRVETSASGFRPLVQQLTGKNSDVERYAFEANNAQNNDGRRIGDGVVAKEAVGGQEDSQVWSSNVYSEHLSQMDVLGSYDEPD